MAIVRLPRLGVQKGKSVTEELTRRDAIKLGAAVTVAVSIEGTKALAQQPATFFTREELALVDELAEMIIPTDDHSPGARAAKVAAYIDARLAEAFDPAGRTMWRDGLKSIDRLSRDVNGRLFMESAPAERLAVLERVAAHETKPEKPEEHFFAELKARVVGAYYTSEIGIAQEMEYKGNTYQPEFSGVDVSKE
jgi:gluconate 2-dehydrogenase subunit 3-like protein